MQAVAQQGNDAGLGLLFDLADGAAHINVQKLEWHAS